MTVHIVCHDCTLEAIREDITESRGRELASVHERTAGHSATARRVARRQP